MKYGIYTLQVITITLALIFSFLMGVKYSNQVREGANWIFAEPEYKVFKKVKRKTIKPVKKPEATLETMEIKKDPSANTENESLENMPEIVGEKEVTDIKDDNKNENTTTSQEPNNSVDTIKEESLNKNTSGEVNDSVETNSTEIESENQNIDKNIDKNNDTEKEGISTPLELMEKANAQNTGNTKNSKRIKKAMEILN